MPSALLSRQEMLDRLLPVFRQRGFAGASLAELSQATGLGRSSLYHSFPQGKDDIVRAVLDHLEAQLRVALFAPLAGTGSPRQRLDAMVATLDAFYRGGEEACLLASLGVGTARPRFQARLAAIFQQWVDAIAATLVEAELPERLARERAEDAVIRVEGALVLAGGLADPAVFDRTLRRLPAQLLAPAEAG